MVGDPSALEGSIKKRLFHCAALGGWGGRTLKCIIVLHLYVRLMLFQLGPLKSDGGVGTGRPHPSEPDHRGENGSTHAFVGGTFHAVPFAVSSKV